MSLRGDIKLIVAKYWKLRDEVDLLWRKVSLLEKIVECDDKLLNRILNCVFEKALTPDQVDQMYNDGEISHTTAARLSGRTTAEYLDHARKEGLRVGARETDK